MRILGTTYYGDAPHHDDEQGSEVAGADIVGVQAARARERRVQGDGARRGARKPTPMNFGELYLALKQNVVDGQENPLPDDRVRQVRRGPEVPGAVTGHILTPRHGRRARAVLAGAVADGADRPPRRGRRGHRLAGRRASRSRERTLRRHVQGRRAWTVITAGRGVVPRRRWSRRCRRLFEAKWGKGHRTRRSPRPAEPSARPTVGLLCRLNAALDRVNCLACIGIFAAIFVIMILQIGFRYRRSTPR